MDLVGQGKTSSEQTDTKTLFWTTLEWVDYLHHFAGDQSTQ